MGNSVNKMWEDYLKSIDKDKDTKEKTYVSWHFENNKNGANELVELVLKGIKKGTASYFDSFDFDNEKIAEVGDLSIITDWDGIAKCIIETTNVEIKPFKDVTEDFAKIEGEGGGILDYWREVHEIYFRSECKRIGKEFSEDILVVCESFKIIFK